MPKLPAVSGEEVVRALKRAGFSSVRPRGSHVVLKDTWGRHRTVVPVHSGQDLKPGTLDGILEDSGLSIEEFRRLLK